MQNWALVVPMANEEADFNHFIDVLSSTLTSIGSGTVYLVTDNASHDKTVVLCDALSKKDPRYVSIFAPQNRNLADAYVAGLRAAYQEGHTHIIEMDAGLSHNPATIPEFLHLLAAGYECVFGSRYIHGGSIRNSPLQRRFLSKTGTVLSSILLGTKLHDMTSGYQGFHRDIAERIITYPLMSTAHFYQTEIRYLLRNRKITEIPIEYTSPSPRVSKRAIQNAYQTLLYYFFLRLEGRAKEL